MIESKSNLKRALDLVLDQKRRIDNNFWESIHIKELNIREGDSSKENLKKWFVLMTGPGFRGGPPPSFEKRKKMVKAFDGWYRTVKNDILSTYKEQDAVNEMIRQLKEISGVGDKIACVYLRDIIYRFKVWPEFKLEKYLYLPIDKHIRDILINKLNVFNEDEVPSPSKGYFTAKGRPTKKNKRFQDVLNQVHKPRVEFDYFWFVGSEFCSYHLCNFCWIRELCKSPSPPSHCQQKLTLKLKFFHFTNIIGAIAITSLLLHHPSYRVPSFHIVS